MTNFKNCFRSGLVTIYILGAMLLGSPSDTVNGLSGAEYTSKDHHKYAMIISGSVENRYLHIISLAVN
ncbi:MAG: hypothetical protein HY831_02015 [Candidatus Aenigmarchaeota archaeon]|nr:hypothetical protein [Candidatus Aenigmarchaeota archaeon]